MPNRSPDLLLQQREHHLQLAVLERQIRKEAAVEYARMVLAHDLQTQNFMKDYGQMAVRSVFLLNGGALVSLIAFMGSIADGATSTSVAFAPADFMVGFAAFVVGLFLALLSMVLAFINFGFVSRGNADFGSLANAIIRLGDKWPYENDQEIAKKVDYTYHGAVGCGLLSMVAFLSGCSLVMHAFSQ